MRDGGPLEGRGMDDDAIARSKLRSMRRLVLLTLACEGWAVLGYVPYSSHAGAYGLAALALSLCALVGWRDRFATPALGLAFALELGVVASVFPENANHQWLALVILLVLCVAPIDPRADGGSGRVLGEVTPADYRAALRTLRWIAVAGLFWAGVMKLVYGLWIGGEYLAYRIAIDPGFARVLGPLVPDAELTRLVALENRIGEGPFRAASPALVVVSNLTWVAEIGLAIGLLLARLRRFALVAAIALIVAIEAGAREIFFGGLMLGLLLLFARRDRLAPLLPWIGAGYVLWLLRRELVVWLGLGGAGG